MSFAAANLFQKIQNYIGFIDVLDALIGPTYDHHIHRKKKSRSKNARHCSESAPAPKKTSATLHGNASAKKWSPKKGPQKTLQTV